MRLARKLTFAGVLLAGLAMLSTNTAYADPGAGVAAVTGSGTITPGLTALPAPQSVSFGGTATGAFANSSPAADVGNANCSFSGGSDTVTTVAPGDNYAIGIGTVSGGCLGAGLVTNTPINVACSSMRYVRVGNVVLVLSTACSTTVNNVTSSGAVLGAFNFAATGNLNPITSYSLTGVALFAGV